MSNVFCIGNVISRKDLDLEKLRPHGKIYGANALYRTFTPDVLTAVDHGIMHEIYHSGYAYNNECWFRDWTKIPENMYDSLIYAGLTDDEVSDIKKSTMISVNEKHNSKEFVMHGASLRGLVSILLREKEKKIIEKRKINHHALSISWLKDNDKVVSFFATVYLPVLEIHKTPNTIFYDNEFWKPISKNTHGDLRSFYLEHETINPNFFFKELKKDQYIVKSLDKNEYDAYNDPNAFSNKIDMFKGFQELDDFVSFDSCRDSFLIRIDGLSISKMIRKALKKL
jgi:hypothetical protein